MPVNLSIKNVPDDLAQRLRERAARNHRSVQGELMAILEQQVGRLEGPVRKLSIQDLIARNRARGLSTPSESAAMIREDRNDDGR